MFPELRYENSLSIEERVLRAFFENPTKEIHIRELAKMLRISPRTAKLHLESQESRKLLKRDDMRGFSIFKADRESQTFRDYKMFYNLRKIRESGLMQYLDTKLNYPAIIFFGSASKGEDIEGSDIDIFAITESKKELDLAKYEKILGKKIQLILRAKKGVDGMKKKNPELLNNVLSGIKLSGQLEVF